MLPSAECVEQRGLRERYLAALRTYLEMVPALDTVSTPREFEEAYERAEGVRAVFIHAGLELRDHIERHGCAPIEAQESAGAS